MNPYMQWLMSQGGSMPSSSYDQSTLADMSNPQQADLSFGSHPLNLYSGNSAGGAGPTPDAGGAGMPATQWQQGGGPSLYPNNGGGIMSLLQMLFGQGGGSPSMGYGRRPQMPMRRPMYNSGGYGGGYGGGSNPQMSSDGMGPGGGFSSPYGGGGNGGGYGSYMRNMMMMQQRPRMRQQPSQGPQQQTQQQPLWSQNWQSGGPFQAY